MNLGEDNVNKILETVISFSIKVLGGRFHVNKVFLLESETPDEVMAEITSIPQDRWFVMVSDTAEAEQNDALAIIDDNLEFQIYAYGRLEQG